MTDSKYESSVTGAGDTPPAPVGVVALLPLDHLLAQLVARASEIIRTQERLRKLLEANRSIVGELSLPAVLRRIVDAARDLGGARYAALGVIGPDGLLEQFVHVGMDEATVAMIGELPRGRGLLGALIAHPEPIRRSAISDDLRSSGFPPNHPPMKTFLGVPIRSRNEVYGNLYLTDREGGDFTAEDEELLLALAATASIAIENARLYEESRRRQEWLRASVEISRELLAPDRDQLEVLQRIAASVQRLADADIVTLVLPTDDPALLEVVVMTGPGDDHLRGLRYPIAGSLAGVAMESGHGIRLDMVDEETAVLVHLPSAVPVGPVMAFPLTDERNARGAIVVGRLNGRRAFAPIDLDMAEAFANHAAIALELSDGRAHQQRLSVLEDRDRIARDLHDHVIQRLFAAGLSVQSAASKTSDPELSDRLRRVVDDLDDTIRQIRTSIFELRDSAETERRLRAVVLSVVGQVSPMLAFRPEVRFAGPIDTLVDASVASDVEAVVREALTNVAKHAAATAAVLELTAAPGRLVVDVMDNGVGLCQSQHRSGLDNLLQRAEHYGGAMTIQEREKGGTLLRWTIPLS